MRRGVPLPRRRGPWRRARAAHALVGILALALTGCGGGSSAPSSAASSGSTSGGSASGSSPSVFSLIGSSVTALQATGQTTTSGTTALLDPVTFSVSASGSYYYQLSFAGTAVSAVTFSGSTAVHFNAANSTRAASNFFGYAIGASETGSWSGNTLQISEVDLVPAALVGAGVYHDQLTLRLCTDAACTHQATGSPITIPVTYTVTGNPLPDSQVTVYPNVEVEAPSTQTTAAGGSIDVQAVALPPTGVYISGGPSTSGFVTASTFTAPLSPGSGSPPQGSLGFSLLPPSSAGVGIHTDTFPINACFEPSCSRQVQGSPFTANVTYIVDPVAGTDFTEHSLNVAVGGMVWDAQNGDLYVLSPTGSPLDPNRLLQIDPTSGTIVNTATLNGGVGQLQPGTLAISSDDQYLYVAISDASGASGQIERLSTSTLATALSITLPAFTLIDAVASAPGAPDTVAVLTESNTPQLMIYDNATPRSTVLSGQNGQMLIAFTWGADATTLYADLGGTSDSLVQVSVNAAGPQVTRTYSSAALSQTPIVSAGNAMNYVNGQVIWNSGAVFDPSSFTLATPFTVNNLPAGSAAFDVPLNRAYFVSADQPPNSTTTMTSIEGFDLATRSPLWFARFPDQSPVSDLTRWGNNGLAFALGSNGGTLVMISGSFIAQ